MRTCVDIIRPVTSVASCKRAYVATYVSMYLVKVSFDDVYIAGNSLEVVVGLLRAEVPRAQYVLDFARYLQPHAHGGR